jgi:hypothetical protein
MEAYVQNRKMYYECIDRNGWKKDYNINFDGHTMNVCGDIERFIADADDFKCR